MKSRSLVATLTLLLPLSVVFSSAGCTSVRSTMYAYDGCQDDTRVKKHLKGIPTTLTVPSHLHVVVKRTRWGKIDANTGAVTFMKDLETQDVEINPITQKEIFTVDFKRPAAGELETKLTFDVKKQFITSIDYSSNDRTIADVTALVAAVLQSVPVTRSSVREAASATPALVNFTSVVASEVFPIREPDVQCQIQEFLKQYVNACNHCRTAWPPLPQPAPAAK